MIEKTGLSIREHQERTTASYFTLLRFAPDLPWAPVIQGFHYDDYFRHVADYRRAGVDLAALPVVGLGSICRRQATEAAEEVIRDLAGLGIKIHAFGFKLQGLHVAARWLASSDSMAWSLDARRSKPLPGCPHRSCANCIIYALAWRERAVAAARTIPGPTQTLLF